MTEPTAFSEASAVRPDGDSYAVHIDPEWTIGGKPNGGYLLATMGRAAVTAHPEHPHVLTASAVYLAAPEPGPGRVSVEVLRAGRNASQARVQLRQADSLCVEALLTLGRLSSDPAPEWSAVPLAEVLAPEQSIRLPPVGPGGIAVAIMSQIDLRIDPKDIGFATAPDGNHQLHGWLTLPGEDFDPTALLYAVDAFPPATFGLGSAGWVPTIELTVYVRALPAPGPLRVLQEVGSIASGRVDEFCRVWDSTGRLVAHSTQLAGIRFGPDGIVGSGGH
ncbi:MAG: thioesterase family protein [Jatrophihabitans sp.]